MVDLINVCPRFTINDFAYYRLMHSESETNLLLGHSRGNHIPNLWNIALFKFSTDVTRPFNHWLPSFSHGVPHIVVICSEKKMFRIATSWVIALVAHLYAFWNLTICQNPCQSVSFLLPKLNASKKSIPTTINGSGPIPAFIWTFFIHLIPKSFFGRIISMPLRPPAFLNENLGVFHNAQVTHK